ncbi:MAG: hypothetical protein DBX55_09840 [Verrucomicrobia bacterium]|nr:MAG: hypothetical protein DBX55_09840 [Verrucomicrobiota bacterium]
MEETLFLASLFVFVGLPGLLGWQDGLTRRPRKTLFSRAAFCRRKKLKEGSRGRVGRRTL